MAFQQRIIRAVMPTVFSKGATENAAMAPAAAPGAAKLFGGEKRAVLGELDVNAKSQRAKAGKKEQVFGRKPVRAAGIRPRQPLHLAEAPMEMDDDIATMERPAVSVFPETLPADVDDIDSADIGNPQLVSEYVTEIYSYMRKLETRHAVGADHLARAQTTITPKMRAILVDWLQEVHQRFKLLPETMYVTVDILDRFLSMQPVSRDKLQLVGVTAMLIGAKYEEMYPPEVGDYVYIADGAYSRAEILAMEGLILKTLDFALGTPLPLHFLRRYSKASGADAYIHGVAKYLMELQACDYDMARFKPSETASAAIWISRKMLVADETWTRNLEHYSGYTEAEIAPCVQELNRVLAESITSKLQSVRRKYASSKLLKISTLPALEQYIAGL